MGEVDVARQAPNVDRMGRLGATVVPVKSGDRTLRAAIDEAIRDWVSDPVGTYYLIGSAIGPHPYPAGARPAGRDRPRGAAQLSGRRPAGPVRVRRRGQLDRLFTGFSPIGVALRRRGGRPQAEARRPLGYAEQRQARRLHGAHAYCS
jgi:hypothetical protein